MLWETDFGDFPTYYDLKHSSNNSTADADEKGAIITDLVLRSTRLDDNTITAATEPPEHGIIVADLRIQEGVIQLCPMYQTQETMERLEKMKVPWEEKITYAPTATPFT